MHLGMLLVGHRALMPRQRPGLGRIRPHLSR